MTGLGNISKEEIAALRKGTAFTDVSGQTRRHTICVDLDGTLLTNRWPEMGEWQPGAIKAMEFFHANDCSIVLASARLNSVDPWGYTPRDLGVVWQARNDVREKLDKAGLQFVTISEYEKVGASVYIDDRGERYTGRRNSWDRLTEKISMRLNLKGG